MIKKRFLLPAAAGALALAIGLAGIWFNQQLPALADFGVSGMDPEAQLMAWAALFPEKGVAALTFRTVLQWMAIAVFCTLGAVVLALYRYKPQKELGYFLLYLTVLTLWALVIILAPVGSSGWSVFFRRGFFTVTVLAGILLCAALTGAVPVSHGQRLHSLLLTLGYLVLTLIPLSRVRAVGLLLGMGYSGLRRCPADAVSLCHHHWLPGMGGPAGHARAVFSGERVFLPVPACPDL